jgi:hypothetical protein
MMCNKRLVLLTVVLLLLGGSNFGQSKGDWLKFVAPDGRFSVLFPRKPRTNTQTQKSSNGKSTVFSATSSEGPFFCGIDQTIYEYDMDDEKRVESIRQHLMVQFAALPVSRSEIEMGGYKGIEIVAIDDDRSLRARILVSGRSSYLVVLSVPYNSDGNEEQIDKFLNSFEILKPVTQPRQTSSHY